MALNLSKVDVTVSVNHGRNTITSGSQPSDASLTIRNYTAIPGKIGDSLVIEAFGMSRFTGDITQLGLTHESSPSGELLPILKIDAIGRMARLGLAMVGASGYPKQTLEARVLAILDEAGLPYQANVKDGNTLRSVGAADGGYSALSLLTTLCVESGATMCDLPDGTILFESYSHRGVGYNPAHWADLPVTDTFAMVPFIWSDIYDSTQTAPLEVSVPGNSIVWAPTWSNDILTVVNDVTVTYGNNQATDDFDTASQATYGRRAVTLGTTLDDLADAQTRAADIIRAQAQPFYSLGNVLVQVDQLSTFTRTNVLELISGSRVGIPGTPQPSPIIDYNGVVEGWSDHYGETGYYITLSLSDPRYSYAVLQWGQATAGSAWTAVDGTAQWFNIVSNVDLF